jgi:hypothetical protein
MKATIEIRADILKTAWVEDRNEVRGIRDSIHNIAILVATASFAITAFLIAHSVHNASKLNLVSDGLLLILLWTFYWIRRRDLYHCRQCLTARERLIQSLGTADEPNDLDPFPSAAKMEPGIDDAELKWLPILTTAIIIIKAILVLVAIS